MPDPLLLGKIVVAYCTFRSDLLAQVYLTDILFTESFFWNSNKPQPRRMMKSCIWTSRQDSPLCSLFTGRVREQFRDSSPREILYMWGRAPLRATSNGSQTLHERSVHSPSVLWRCLIPATLGLLRSPGQYLAAPQATLGDSQYNIVPNQISKQTQADARHVPCLAPELFPRPW